MSLSFILESDNIDSDPDDVQPCEADSNSYGNRTLSLVDHSPNDLSSQPGPSSSNIYKENPAVLPLSETTVNKGRKRVKNVSKWKRNVLKRQKATGVEHKNSSGTLIAARSIGPDCKCKSQCFLKVPDDCKIRIVNNFNEIGDREKQDIMLSGFISLCNIERRRPKTGEGQHRAYSCRYKVRVGSFETFVCKKAFCSLHGVGKARIERIIKNLQEAKATPSDNRGKHHNRPNRISEEAVSNVDRHIQSFPSRTSHYSRNKNEHVRYLSPELNLSKMHKLYLKKYEPQEFEKLENGEKCKPVISYDFYCRHFNNNYKLFFGPPRSDTCQTCDRLENLIKSEKNPEMKEKLVNEKEVHLRKSEEFYKDLNTRQKEAKEKDEVEVISFDFQQNMPLPVVPSGDVFYKRQLWVYNFTICSTKTGKSYCYMYDETTGKKGQNEVISILNHFLKNEVSENVKKLFIFTDNCSAQNKNHALVQYLYTLIKGFNRFDEIHHRYPEPGHSFLPCDRTFGVIEKERRRRERLYLPQDYYDMVQKTSKKFVVIIVKQEIFLDFCNHLQNIFLKPSMLYSKIVVNKENSNQVKRAKKTTKGTRFTISKYRHLIYNKNDLLCSKSSSSLLQDAFILEKSDIRPTNFSLPDPDRKLYHGQLGIKPKKLNDVLQLAQKYVPPDCMWYYNKLTAEGTVRQETERSGSEDAMSDD